MHHRSDQHAHPIGKILVALISHSISFPFRRERQRTKKRGGMQNKTISPPASLRSRSICPWVGQFRITHSILHSFARSRIRDQLVSAAQKQPDVKASSSTNAGKRVLIRQNSHGRPEPA
ncbi:hypothetical protein VTJ04DRAFT_9501 [Mycothermus thermophilus]|uniref:uncharacterized protein n=1 Tax=Humicola insolens TaxID=85995 RepID=UPI003744AF42